MRARLLLALAVGLLSTLPAAAEDLAGRVVGVLDGDTVVVLDARHEQHRIRLAQIDAPEIGHGRSKPGQPFGQRAKQALSDLAYNRNAIARCANQDRYGRLVCQVLVDGRDVNLALVQLGMAWVYRQYGHDPAYFQAEDQARRGRVGLWADPNPVPPWDYRHSGD